MQKENNVVNKRSVIPEGCNRGSSTHLPFRNETTNDKRGRFPSPSRTGELGNDALFLRQVSPDLQTFNAPLHPAQKHCGMTNGAGGFTLIELLVVVLIIGILAGVALPKYEQAVVKSRIAAVLPYLSAVKNAEEIYYLANGRYTSDLEDLSVEGSCPSGWTCYLMQEDADSVGAKYRGEDEMSIVASFTHRADNPAWADKIYCWTAGPQTKYDKICKSLGEPLAAQGGSSSTRYAIQ